MQTGGSGNAGLADASFAAEEQDAHTFILTGGSVIPGIEYPSGEMRYQIGQVNGGFCVLEALNHRK